jgi:hypothetical protein
MLLHVSFAGSYSLGNFPLLIGRHYLSYYPPWRESLISSGLMTGAGRMRDGPALRRNDDGG